MPEVSIIMPNYNCADFIGQAIASVLAQSYQDWELIVTDDASTDRSREVMASHAAGDARIRLVFNKENKGVATCRNQAIGQAQGKYIAFLDSDDVWYPEKLHVQMEYIRAHSAELCHSAYDLMNAAGEKISTIPLASTSLNYEDMLKGERIGMLMGIVNRSILPDPPFQPVNLNETVMWLSLVKRGYIAHGIRQPLGCYRLRRGSLSSSKLQAVHAMWRLLRDHEQLGLKQSVIFFLFYFLRMLRKYIIILPYVLRWR